MSIEDITYLNENSIEEDTVIFIDSGDRDQIKYKRANSYVVEFAEPFKNVFGMEVIDASIPRTMFNLDKYNNIWKFVIGEDPIIEDNYTVKEILPGDYTIDDMVSTFETNLTDSSSRNISLTGVSTPPSLSSKVRFTSDFPFTFDMDIENSVKNAVGFGNIACVEDATDTTYSSLGNYTMVGSNIHLFGSIKVDLADPVDNTYGTIIDTTSNLQVSSTQWVAQRFFVEEKLYLEAFSMNFDTIGSFTSYPSTITAEIYEDDLLATEPGTLITSTTITVDTTGVKSTPNPITTVEHEFTFLDPTKTYWAVVRDPGNTSTTDTLAVTTTNYDTNNLAFVTNYQIKTSSDSGVTWDIIDDDDTDEIIPTTVFTFVTIARNFTMITPGIVALVGERFTVLRVPEIETHLYGSTQAERTPGLALFKLAIVGFATERFDFVTVKYKKFHPIGKLSRVTLEFEDRRGNPYLFKGVNHHLLISIKTFKVKPRLTFEGSTLNPNYDPNYRRYLKNIEQKAESSSEEDIDDNEFRNNYLKAEAKFNWRDNQQYKYTQKFDDYVDSSSTVNEESE